MVSIIVPVYNVSKYLSKCIESLIHQKYKNIEIILVNDGSSDNSLNICKKYQKKDNRIVLIDKKNGGVSSARNAGVAIAKGEYIVFVDGDDYLELDFVKYMVDIITKNNCDFAISKNCFKYENEKQVLKDHVEYIDAKEATVLVLSLTLEVGCWNKMYKKELISNIRFDEKQFFGEGLQFITCVAQRANITAVGERKVYHYRQDNVSSATKKYNYYKLVNGEKSLELIESHLIIHDDKVYHQLYTHYCMFYYNAIALTLKNDSNKEYSDAISVWKKKAKKNYKYLFKNKEIKFKDKVRVFVLLYFTFIYQLKYLFKR